MADMKKPMPMPTKGTQADHYVTDNNNHTRPLPKDQQAIVDVVQRLGNANKKSK